MNTPSIKDFSAFDRDSRDKIVDGLNSIAREMELDLTKIREEAERLSTIHVLLTKEERTDYRAALKDLE